MYRYMVLMQPARSTPINGLTIALIGHRDIAMLQQNSRGGLQYGHVIKLLNSA